MLPTSDTYNFQSVQVELLIREAYERIGITGEFLDILKIDSAKRSLNLLLLEWMSKSTNLWSLRSQFLTLFPGKGQYVLPSNVLDIVQVNLRTSARQLSPQGIAQSNSDDSYDNNGGGIALNAYTENNTSGCIQTAINGNISYDFGINNSVIITFIGIQSEVTANYQLNIQVCEDGDDPADPGNWIIIHEIPLKTYEEGITEWFDLPIPITGRYYRIIEVNEDSPSILKIRQIFNNNNTFDFNISDVSRYDYINYPNKFLRSRPNIYYLDRQIEPILNIWPTPAPQYNCLIYSYKCMLQDVTSLTDTIEMPAKMYPALIWGLSYYLSIKFNPQLMEMMQSKYEKSFYESSKEDTEDVKISIRGESYQ